MILAEMTEDTLATASGLGKLSAGALLADKPETCSKLVAFRLRWRPFRPWRMPKNGHSNRDLAVRVEPGGGI